MKRHRVTGRSPTGNRTGGPRNGNAAQGVEAQDGERKEAAKLQGGYYQDRFSEESLFALELVTEGDRRFFARRRDRATRIRLASWAEILQFGAESAVPGTQWFAVVRHIGPGHRLRVLFLGPEDAETDVSESRCAMIYRAVTEEAQS